MSSNALRTGVMLCAIVGCTSVGAQFQPTVPVTDGSGGYTAPEVVRIANDIIAIATTSTGTVYHSNTLSGFPAVPQLIDPQPQGGISLTAAAVFLQSLAYEQTDGSGGPGERDIRVAQNGAGPFDFPEIITDNDTDDFDPHVVVSALGERHLAWVSDETPGTPVVRWKRAEAPDEIAAIGTAPQLVRAGGTDVLLIYARGGDLHGRLATPTTFEPEVGLLDTPTPITAWRAAGALDGSVHLASVEGGALVHRSGDAFTGFGTATPVDPGPVDGTPAVGVDSLGRAVVVWASGGTVYFSRAEAGVFSPAVSVGSPAGSTDPALAIDSVDYLHVAGLAAGEVWYTNDVPPPTAEFVVQNGSGVLPVEVTFQDASSGVITNRLWDFGDGTTSSEVAPMHTYTEPGSFPVSLTVSGPGGEDTSVVANAVSTTLPPNVMELADIVAFGGQPVIQPVLGSHPDPLQGFQVTLVYDEMITPISTVNFNGTEVDSLAPEFVVIDITPNGTTSELILAVIFDTLPPFDGRTLSPGVEQTIGNLIYTVPFGLPLGSVGPLSFVDGLGSPPINNMFAVEGGLSTPPYTLDGSCTVSAQPQFLFIRGDANYNQGVDIADAIFVLAFLFSGGPSPQCPDSSDANDDGQINIGDSIYVLGFLFSSGPTLPYPFPGLGIDPTEDALDICNPSPTGP